MLLFPSPARAETVPVRIERVIVGLSGGRVVAHVTGHRPNPCYRAGAVQQVRRGREIEILVTMQPPEPDAVCPQIVVPVRESVPLEGDFPPGEYTLRVNDVARTFRLPLEVQADPLVGPVPPRVVPRTGAGWQALARQDYATALRELIPVAERGDAEAQLMVGNLHYFGWGVAPDRSAAARWYRRAAEQGLAAAQFNLGVVTARGEGVPRNLPEAYVWIRLAENGLDAANRQEASRERETLASRLTRDEAAQAEERVRAWTPKPEPRR